MPGIKTYAGNVAMISSTAGLYCLPEMKRITAIKYFPGVNSSAAILSGGTSATPGVQLWLENSTSGAPIVNLLSIYDSDGVTVSLGGGAQIFIYGTVSRSV